MKNGKLYGVGVGPGDPRLMTVLAAETIRSCPVIAVPGKDRKQAVSYRIAAGLIRGLDEKECLCLPAPMTRDEARLQEAHEAAADQIGVCLKAGKDVAYLTLGDPTIYSTYIYIHRLVRQRGFETEIINGIPSFCAAAARLGDSLSDRSEQLHIIPSSYGMGEALALPGTKVLMKSGSRLFEVKQALKECGAEASMVENCGMEGERIYRGLEEIPDEASYYSLIILREGRDLRLPKS